MSSRRLPARPVIFGEVLFDCFPDGSRVLGGAPFNVAWHSQAFGLKPLFISRVGNDPSGRLVKSAMLDWGMDVSGLQLDSAHPSGMVTVSFEHGEPAYEIVEHSAWDFIDHQATPEIDPQSVLYHGSLALRNATSAASLHRLRRQCRGAVFIDVNLRSPWWNLPLIEDMLPQGKWIKLNEDELALLLPGEKDVEAAVRKLLDTTGLELIVVTLGAAGAMAFTNQQSFSVKPEGISKVVDTVGAGDAFTSILLLGLHRAWPLQTILNRAQRFASAVVGQRGATTTDKTFYQPFIEAWSV